jgi:WD40 repeat protein
MTNQTEPNRTEPTELQPPGRVCYWELVDAQLVRSFQAHRGPVCGVATHPKGGCLLTAGVDGTVKVWTAGAAG